MSINNSGRISVEDFEIPGSTFGPPRAQDGGGKADSPKLLAVDDVLRLKHPGWLVDRLLPADSISCVYGPPGAGKSFVVLDLLIAIARGKSWHGFDTERNPVVYCCGEGGHSLGLRLLAWLRAFRLTPEELAAQSEPVLFALQVPPLLAAGGVETLAAAIRETLGRGDDPLKPGLIAIDTLSRAIVGADENSAQDMSRAIDAADRLRKLTGAGVLLVHHTGKTADKGERGSSALRGGVDTLLELKSKGRGAVELLITKQKDGAPIPAVGLVLESIGVGNDDQGRPLTSCYVRSRTPMEPVAEHLADLRGSEKAVLELLGRPEHATAGLTAGEACVRLQGKSEKAMPRTTFYRAADALVSAGSLEKRGTKYRVPPAPEPAPGDTEVSLDDSNS